MQASPADSPGHCVCLTAWCSPGHRRPGAPFLLGVRCGVPSSHTSSSPRPLQPTRLIPVTYIVTRLSLDHHVPMASARSESTEVRKLNFTANKNNNKDGKTWVVVLPKRSDKKSLRQELQRQFEDHSKQQNLERKAK